MRPCPGRHHSGRHHYGRPHPGGGRARHAGDRPAQQPLVLRAQRMRWMLENDNSVRQELHAAILQRQRELRVARDLNAAERAAAVK